MLDLNHRAVEERVERGGTFEDMIYLLLHRPLHNLDLDERNFVIYANFFSNFFFKNLKNLKNFKKIEFLSHFFLFNFTLFDKLSSKSPIFFLSLFYFRLHFHRLYFIYFL